MKTHDIDTVALKRELTVLKMSQWKLAMGLNMSPSVLGNYLAERRTPPANLRQRIEKFMGLAEGRLLRRY